MHAQCPLETDPGPFHRLQQLKRCDEGEWQINRQLQPHGRRIIGFDPQHGRYHDMADDDDHEISGQVVGPMWRVVETADRAVVIDLQEGAKQLALAAAGAAAPKAALHRGPDVALLGLHGIPGPDWRRGAHRFHDLPFFGLPGFGLPGLRSFLRGLRPGCAFDGVACALEPSRPPSRFLPPGIPWPSDNSTNRTVLSTGAASTRRTSTTSPNRCMAPLREPTSAWRVSS